MHLVLSYKAHFKYTRGSHASTTCGWHRPVSPQLYHARSVLLAHPRALQLRVVTCMDMLGTCEEQVTCVGFMA